MSRRLERLLQIDALIRSGRRQTADSLADALEVSERTIRDDLAYLRDRYEAPLEFNKRDGHYYTDTSWRLPTIPLSLGELFAVTLGARMLEVYAGSAYAAELQSAIARLAERIPEQTWVDLQTLSSENVIFRAGAELEINPQIWHDLQMACQSKQRVWIHYYTAGRDAHSERKLDPYILHFSRNNPYVTGYCHRREAIRWFRVDRIQSLNVLDETFEVDPNFDPKTHLDTAFQHEVGGTPQPVAIWFDAATAPYIRERRWHPTQQIEEHTDKSLTLHFVARGLNEVKRWVLFYGKGAVVKSPPKLVQMIVNEIAAMNQFYAQQENPHDR